MRKGPLSSMIIGVLGALASYLLIIIDTLTFGGGALSWLFLPFHIAIALFVVFFKKPTAWELILSIITFIPVYILIIKSYFNFYIYDIVMNYSASYPEIHVAIIFDLAAICFAFIIGSIVRLAFYANEKSNEQMKIQK